MNTVVNLNQPPQPSGQQTISQLIAARQTGHMLPADLYLRSDVFETDLDLLFRNEWILIGTAADVPEPGDAFTVEVGNSSAIIIRDDDEVIRAFHNICRHRASRLLDPGSTNVAKLTCPYHQWTYELTGELLFAKNMGPDFDRKHCGLLPIHLRDVGGLLFISFANQAPEGIEALADVMEPRLAPYDLANTQVAHEESIVEECNWKLTIENNRECYHCGVGHPELTQSYPAAVLGCSTEEMTPDEAREMQEYNDRLKVMQARWDADGIGHEYVERTAPDQDTYFSTERYLIGGEGESATLDTRIACQKLMGDLERKDMGDLNLWTHTAWLHFFCDHAVIVFITPLSAHQTRVTTKWLVHAQAQEGVDYDVDNLTRVWHATNQQDGTFVERQQQGVADPDYIPGPYSPAMEEYVDLFTNWYLGRLQAHGY